MKTNSILVKVAVHFFMVFMLAPGICKNVKAQDSRWTIMVYLDADNNLEDVAITDFNEMESVGSTDSVNIIVQFDRIAGYDDTNGDWTDTRRFRVLHDTSSTEISTEPVEIMGEKNMGDPETLTEFIDWSVSNYPADNYALIFWNHGGGWRSVNENSSDTKAPGNNPFTKDVCFDNTSDDYLSNYEVSEAISMSSIRPEIIAFDACLMGMIEVAYQLRDLAEIMVASEDLVPWDGYNYKSFLNELVNDHNMSADTLSSILVKTYGEYYEYSDVTNAAINLKKIRNITEKLDTLIINIIDNGTVWEKVGQARGNTQSFDLYDYFDLWSLADLLEISIADNKIKDAADSLKNAISDAVIENYASDYYNYARGLSIYFPLFEDYDPEYGDRLFSKDFPDSTKWINFLSEFYENYITDKNEPNNHFANASSVYFPDAQSGILKNLNDIDIFRFYYNGINDASVILTPPANFNIYLYSVTDTIILPVDSSLNTSTANDTIFLTGLPSNIYYLVVTPLEISEDPYELYFNNISSLYDNDSPITHAYDDGIPDYQYYSNLADTGIGMKFTGDGNLLGVWYYITDLDVEAGGGDLGLLNLHILDYYYMIHWYNYVPVVAEPDHVGWNFIDLSDQEIEFYNNKIVIGFTWDGSNTPAIGMDSTFSDYNSYSCSDASWELLNDSVLFFIRPVYDLTSNGEDTCYCNEFTNLTNPIDTISDGSGENDYANDSYCTWLISSEEQSDITLTFTEFDTEYGFDYVKVYDGINNMSPIIGEYSGQLSTFSVTSSGGAMFIEFYSDEMITSGGWEAYYTIEKKICYCQELSVITELSGIITDGSDSLDYGNNSNCLWLIQMPQNRSISLQFTEFDLENSNDSVKIYDGNSTGASILDILTGEGHNNLLTSSGNSLIIKFKTDNSIVAEGWKCLYSSSIISNNDQIKFYDTDIFPNPGMGIINIDFKSGNHSFVSLVITNSIGNIIKSINIQTGINKMSVDISAYPPGLYLIKITDGNSNIVRKYMLK